MPIVEPAELLGHITTSDGRRIPHYKVKTETTITPKDIMAKSFKAKKIQPKKGTTADAR